MMAFGMSVSKPEQKDAELCSHPCDSRPELRSLYASKSTDTCNVTSASITGYRSSTSISTSLRKSLKPTRGRLQSSIQVIIRVAGVPCSSSCGSNITKASRYSLPSLEAVPSDVSAYNTCSFLNWRSGHWNLPCT